MKPVTNADVRAGLFLMLGKPLLADQEEADACQCRACQHSEPMRPTITERVMRFRVERITEPLVLKHITASELWSVREWGRRAHFIALGGGRIACTSDHTDERPANTDADCADACTAVTATRLNESLNEQGA